MKKIHDLNMPIPAEQLIPHRKPMCLIDRLIEYNNAQSCIAEVKIRSENLLLDNNGNFCSPGLIEMIAQTCAAMKGYESLISNKRVQKGFLVGIRQTDITGSAVLGDILKIYVTLTANFGGFIIAEGKVINNQNIIAVCNLKLYVEQESVVN